MLSKIKRRGQSSAGPQKTNVAEEEDSDMDDQEYELVSGRVERAARNFESGSPAPSPQVAPPSASAYPPIQPPAQQGADGRDVTGFEAYKTYGKASGPIFSRVGGTIIWRGRPQLLLIGPADERWDLAFIARYPSANAFLEMVKDEVYQNEAVPHRQAAVEDSRLLRHKPLEGLSEFG